MLYILNDILAALEGPYKWYGIIAALTLIGLLVTKTMFKALKWILIIGFFLIVGLIAVKFSDVIQY